MISGMFKEKLFEEKILLFLKVITAVTVINLCLLLKSHTQHLFIKEVSELSEDASKRDFCGMAINQMIHKNLSKLLIEESLYSQVVADNYKAMLLDDVDKVSSVYSGEDSCKVLVHTKDGMRSFDLILDKGSDFKYFYQITKIHENELTEKESQDS